MGFLALAVLVVVAIAVAIGVHTGPHGLLAAGTLGVAASVGFIVGIVVLAPSSSRTSIGWALLATAAFVSTSAIVAGAAALPALRRHQPAVGSNRLWGADGVVLTDLTPSGTVRVRGETWTAESLSGRLLAGAPVHVVEVDGLHLKVLSDSAMVPGSGELTGPESEDAAAAAAEGAVAPASEEAVAPVLNEAKD